MTQLDSKLAAGGEAVIWSIVRRPDAAAKIYSTPPSQARTDKLKAMVDAPPQDPAARQGHVSICWPRSLLYNERQQCRGFVMPRLDGQTSKPVFHFFNPLSRQALTSSVTWEFLVRAAANIASVVHAIHSCGYVIGDLNESNFMVSDRALVSLVDCDSMQVPRPGGRGFFRCTVGKPEYIAPELHGADFSQVDRTVEQDRFSLGILLFQLLMEGTHPYAGIWRGAGDPTLTDRMKRGESPYANGKHVTASPWALPLAILPPELRALVGRCFGEGHGDPKRRPSAQEWHRSLTALAGQLRTCRNNPLHVHWAHLSDCIWCRMVTVQGVEDHFPGRAHQTAPRPTTRQPAAPVTKRPQASGWRILFKALSIGAALGVMLLLYAAAAIIDWFGFHAVQGLNSILLWIGATFAVVKVIGRWLR